MIGLCLDKLTVQHNHGSLVMRDVVIVDDVAYGFVVAGGRTSRLFSAHSYDAYPVGKWESWPLYGRTVHGLPIKADGYFVNCTFCG